MTADDRVDVAVVGAGLAGLVAARALVQAGLHVAVLDEGARPGGRLATRRVGAANLDEGAQFFTVRSERFAGLVDGWRASGCPVRVWSDGFAQAPSVQLPPSSARPGGDGHARLVVDGGMNTLALHVAAGLDVRCHARVTAVASRERCWQVHPEAGDRLLADRLLLTPPVPQALEVLDCGEVALDPDERAALEAVAYEPCLALLAVLDRRPALPHPGGVQFAAGPVTWIADNQAKGVSTVPAVTVHAGPHFSAENLGTAQATVSGVLAGLVRPWLGDARIVETDVAYWRFSKPVAGDPRRALRASGLPPLVFAGDAFGGAKVEGATLSGVAAAAALRE